MWRGGAGWAGDLRYIGFMPDWFHVKSCISWRTVHGLQCACTPLYTNRAASACAHERAGCMRLWLYTAVASRIGRSRVPSRRLSMDA